MKGDEEAGTSESAARDLPRGRGKALQQTNEGEKREKKTGLAIKDVHISTFL